MYKRGRKPYKQVKKCCLKFTEKGGKEQGCVEKSS